MSVHKRRGIGKERKKERKGKERKNEIKWIR